MDRKAIHPRVSINSISTWNWTLDQDLDFFRKIGATAINPPFLKFAGDPQAGITAIGEAGLQCCSLSGGGKDNLIESEEATLATLKPYIDAADALGAPSIYFVTGPTPPRMPTDEAYARFVDAIGAARDYAAARNIRLAIEHNSTTTRDIGFVHTLAAAADVTRRAGIGVCLELQNCWYEPELPRLFRDNVDLFTVVQVSDFLVGEPQRLNRRVPGDGTIALEWMLSQVIEAGYEGYFDIELIGPAIEAEGYESAVGRSVDWLSERLFSWGV